MKINDVQDKGTARLLADIANARPVTLEEDCAAALAILDGIGANYRSVTVNVTRIQDDTAKVQFQACAIEGKNSPAVLEYGDSACAAAAKVAGRWNTARREAEIARRVRAEMDMLEAVEAAEKSTPVMFEDALDARNGGAA